MDQTVHIGFPNYAGRTNVDGELETELELAGITVTKMPESFRRICQNEVKTIILGELYGWSFERGWRYWIAIGPGIPVKEAMLLHEKFGKEVRVAGHAGCPSPLAWNKGFGTGSYHVDTQEGLRALADTIKVVAAVGMDLTKKYLDSNN